EGRTVGRALPCRQAQFFQSAATGGHAEWHHFHRQHTAAAERRHDLLAADEDYETPSSAGDNFLTHQRSAQALDEIVLRINFIGAVHVDVDLLDVVKRDQRNAELPGQLRGFLRSRHTADVQALADTLTERLDKRGGSAAGTEADYIALANQSQCFVLDLHGVF